MRTQLLLHILPAPCRNLKLDALLCFVTLAGVFVAVAAGNYGANMKG
jgi:hypothetical protein